MINRVLEKGSTDVDGISGATYSSDGFLDAVDNALDKAK
ncbi:MAG: FMN-binding protein [Pseudobutyrivibrio sp.]|nr:FMN-binding protein [Pseudobutyrivibrio sp.]